MFNKLAFIALVCVSVCVAQPAPTNELEDAINTALKHVDQLNQAGNLRYQEVVEEGNFQIDIMAYKTDMLSLRAESLKDNSTSAIRNFAAVAEEKARECNHPDSVFRCIRTNEQKANFEINLLTDRFHTQLERMRVDEKKVIQNVLGVAEELRNKLGVAARKASKEIRNCKNTQCVKDAVGPFDDLIGVYFEAMFKSDNQITDSYHTFDNASRNNYAQFTVQISRTMTAAMKAIKMCLNNGKADDFGVEHQQNSEQDF